MKNTLFFPFILLIFASAICFAAPDAKEIIDNVQKKLESATLIQIQFEETYLWALTGEENTLEGEMVLGEDDQFRITTEDQILVSDGKTLWTYSIPANRVLVDKVSDSKDSMLPRQILFRYTHDLDGRFEGEVEFLGKKCYIINFQSEESDSFITSMRIWVDVETWLPVKVEQTDLSENKSIYLLKQIELLKETGNQSFKFEIPEGADVIHMQ